MPTYKIKALQIAEVTYVVEAGDVLEAMRQADPRYNMPVETDVLSEFVEDRGMSFEEAERLGLGLDADAIRSEFNGNNNHDHVEAIISIQELKK